MKIIAKPIEMIAWFTTDGSPNPMKFRLENDEGAFSVIKVDKILFKNMEKLAGNNMLIFRCQSLVRGAETVYEIKYELRTMKWILYKI